MLGKIILEGNPQSQNDNKKKGGNQSSNEPNFNNEIGVIDDKVKSECAKIYTGNFAKYLNPTEKIVDSLIPFLENIKKEMELMRLRCVKDLRIFVKIYINFHLIFQKVLLNLFLVILV